MPRKNCLATVIQRGNLWKHQGSANGNSVPAEALNNPEILWPRWADRLEAAVISRVSVRPLIAEYGDCQHKDYSSSFFQIGYDLTFVATDARQTNHCGKAMKKTSPSQTPRRQPRWNYRLGGAPNCCRVHFQHSNTLSHSPSESSWPR